MVSPATSAVPAAVPSSILPASTSTFLGMLHSIRFVTSSHRRSLCLTGAALGFVLSVSGAAAQTATPLSRLTDRVFAPWDSSTRPGCAVGIAQGNQPRFTRAYGLAELEFGAPNAGNTIFEAGSVSKQFTAAAVVLLALDGKLRLDDDVRKYMPELRAYERPITIRHLLNHTSGLRDWGDIAALAGWPRSTRVHTHDHVLEIIARQSALNYPPGDKYSYTNSGFNLLPMIVARVSGQSFAQFSRDRIFTPLGLTYTSWRDDFTRVVKGRAQAYAPARGAWMLDMPFENVHGNGGLLTTVDDLLTWTAMLEKPDAKWKPLVDSMHVKGRLTNGDTISYALGLFVDQYRGIKRVQHSGATAGYRAYVTRYPGRDLAIAVLCNAASANPTAYANVITDSLLRSVLAVVPARAAAAAPTPAPAGNAAAGIAPWTPTAAQLREFVGEYYSADVEATYSIRADSTGGLLLVQRPASRARMRALSVDTFDAGGQPLTFKRDASGRVTELHVATARAYDVVFGRR